MPDPNRLIPTFKQAVTAFRQTPGRRGKVIYLDGAKDVLVAGDMHGSIANFKVVLQRADLARNPSRHVVLQEFVHGPFRYPTGGDKSHQLLDLLAALKCQYPRQVHMLLGNHELAQWTGKLISKDEHDLNSLFREGVNAAYGLRAEDVYKAYLELFAVLPLAIRTPNRIYLSHSLPSASRLPNFKPAILEKDVHDDADLSMGGTVHSLVWGRDVSPPTIVEFLEKVDADLLISGHIPCERGFHVPNDRQLILDSQDQPACYCLFPVDRPLSQADLVACVGLL